MSTLAQMRSRIADDMMRSDLSTQIDLAINRAIEYYYNDGGFWFDETTGTFATIVGQETYGTADGLPSDIGEIDFVRITLSSTNKPELLPRSYPWIQKNNIGSAQGVPSDYAWYQNKIYLYLIPNAVNTVTLSYRKTYAVLSADPDTNNYTTYAQDLIEARAQWWLYDRVLFDDARAATMKKHEEDAYRVLMNRDEALTSNGEVEATGF